jgi:SH3-like domain-containing protein
VDKSTNPRHKTGARTHIDLHADSSSNRILTALNAATLKQLAIACVLALCGATSIVAAAEKTPAEKPVPALGSADEAADGGASDSGQAGGLPIPRFVSLRTNPINLRTGPGVRYPVDWVYMRRNLPVEVIGEFDTWRRIRDQDGAEGWVHQSMLSGKRTAVVRGGTQALRRTGEDASEAEATVEAGVVVNVLRCPSELPYCRIEASGAQGWIKRDALWGVYAGETLE